LKYLVLLTALLGFANGCTPDLAEGRYTCPDEICPDGWHCLSDGRCHEQLLPPYAVCGGHEDCVSGVCYSGPETNTFPGYCSDECTSANQCAPNPDASRDEVCGMNHCLVECHADEDCDLPARCLVAPGAAGKKACYNVATLTYSSKSPCVAGTCPAPLACIRDSNFDSLGVCAWPCGMPDDTCPMMGECLPYLVTVTPPLPTSTTCLAPCQNTSECMNGLQCLAFPDTMKHCVPPGWLAAQ
jgi:hypothetical protein